MREELRARIVEAAVRLLETHGAKGFGQVKVAREAGVQQGHLTYYFPKKSALALAVIERLQNRSRLEFEKILGQAQKLPRAELYDLFFAQVRAMMKDRKRSRVMLGLAAEAQDDPEVAKMLARHLGVQRAGMATLLGRSPDDVDVHIALAALRGLGIEHLVARGDDAQVDEVVARFRSWLEVRT